MKDGALFIGWGSPIAGRELAGLDVFKEAKEFYEGWLKRGEITAVEPVLLSYVGGPLYGFFLLRGEPTKIAKLMTDEAFMRLSTKASLVYEKVTIVPAFVGDAVPTMIDTYRTEVNTLALQLQHV